MLPRGSTAMAERKWHGMLGGERMKEWYCREVKLVVIVVRKLELELELSPDKAPLYPTLASFELYLMQIRVFCACLPYHMP